MNERRVFGRADWRLPNRRELFSLVGHGRINPALDENHPFHNVFPGYYWTSTTCARTPDQAWYIHLGGARVHKGMKHGSYLLWPVGGSGDHGRCLLRTGQKLCYDETGRSTGCEGSGQDGEMWQGADFPVRRFEARDEAVYDNMTGLTWSENADLASGAVDWSDALKTAAILNEKKSGGFADWRLPNIRELESLVDMGAHSPALCQGHPFENVWPFYWSSTTSVYETSYAWALYTRDGYVGVGQKSQAGFHVWAVRGSVAGEGS
jgi:hypothetical protein